MEINVSDYISAGSLLVAIIALFKSFLSDRKVKKLDVQLKEKELEHRKTDEENLKKADIEVQVTMTEPKKAKILSFRNKGQATAINVSFKIVSDVEGYIQLRMEKDYLPYPKLLPCQNFNIPFFNFESKPHQTILITWDDDFAKRRSKEMVVDM